MSPTIDRTDKVEPVRIGTAGWSIPRAQAAEFPASGTGLERYAAVFNAAEINTTFYRPHRATTFERWRDSVPDGFRFSVKVPKTVTHELRLIDANGVFEAFVQSLQPLGDRLGPLLLQFPPNLQFNAESVKAFLSRAREVIGTTLMFEPRHATWFTEAAEDLLVQFGVTRAAADPARAAGAAEPGGDRQLTYFRLHGSPRIYYSAYDDAALAALTPALLDAPGKAWCIFDNTASGAAIADALRMRKLTSASDRDENR